MNRPIPTLSTLSNGMLQKWYSNAIDSAFNWPNPIIPPGKDVRGLLDFNAGNI